MPAAARPMPRHGAHWAYDLVAYGAVVLVAGLVFWLVPAAWPARALVS